MDKKNRWGVRKITDIARDKFQESARGELSGEDIERWNNDSISRGYVAHNYPDSTWEEVVDFTPDAVFYSQITIGLAVNPGESQDILAKILICREKSHDFTKIIWRPSS